MIGAALDLPVSAVEYQVEAAARPACRACVTVLVKPFPNGDSGPDVVG